MSLAFKEWAPVIRALGSGEQSLIIRKGGIDEDNGRFDIIASRFWLIPTFFHAQRDKIKPASRAYLGPAPAVPTISSYAKLVSHEFVNNWSAVLALDTHHILTEATVKERFNWGDSPGVHVLRIRTFRLQSPFPIELTAEQSGCKSWVDIDPKIENFSATPVSP